MFYKSNDSVTLGAPASGNSGDLEAVYGLHNMITIPIQNVWSDLARTVNKITVHTIKTPIIITCDILTTFELHYVVKYKN
ncbi:hypothetical protein TUM12151_12370 [Morganella morganii]|nr:hypothetical protein TUM12149_08220 [Morganella morganii]GIZ29587.1 hypothetical protein TUM12150_00730 [Morganella morganii]GIZ34251.1 hypothetical protein TUM12151_12370 [Morganella morganii]